MLTHSTLTPLLLALCSMHMAPVDSLPVDSRLIGRATTDDPPAAVTMPKAIWNMLTNINDGADGLFSLYRNTGFFVQKTNELYKPQHKPLAQKNCLRRVFNLNKGSKSSLVYSELTNYYNELVLQLKLAEHNLEVAIDLEIMKVNRAKSSEKQSNIIGLLKESILPALEYTLNITQSETNCPATALIADMMTSFSTDCASCLAVYSSNASLKQTTAMLFSTLENDKIMFSDESPTLSTSDSSKEWCIVL